MKLINFEIGNFKAFGTTQTIEFGLPNEKALGSGLTIIVGPNNSGKSTILKSIRSLASHEEELIAGIDDRRGQEPVWLRLVARDKDRNFEVAVEQHSQGAYLKKTNPFDTGWGLNLRSIPARRPWQDRFVAQQGMGSFNYENSLYANLRNNEFYIDGQFGSAIREVEKSAERKSKYTALLRRLEPSISEWSIDNNGQDFVSFKSVSGSYHRAGLLGEGVHNLFRIAYSLFEFGASDILLLDEPELSLHPQAQRRLHEELRRCTIYGQIVLSTHSPHFVSWADINVGAKIYRTGISEREGATIRTLSERTISKIGSIANEKKNRKLYDVLAKEVFFSLGCLFVEGQEDAHIISNFLNETDRNIEIFGYGSGGASHISSWLDFVRELNIRAVALFDGDPAGSAAYSQAAEKFLHDRKVMVRKLITDDIRDKPNEEKEGIFDEAWKLKPTYAVYWSELVAEIVDFLSGESPD